MERVLTAEEMEHLSLRELGYNPDFMTASDIKSLAEFEHIDVTEEEE